MSHTEHYLDLVKQRLELPSDYAAAKALNVSRQCVSGWRTGRTTFDDATAREVARMEPGSARADYYTRQWDVPAKIRAAKARGDWPPGPPTTNQ